ncbi:hypothetical protein BT67DRAFT_392206 [Trichocladium antarcticum]|uniref:Uncharacterized protein n=1 Tax=Trichocladium antarcticum TaxID=1450529 RepID=A0AAN6Z9G7_9PEZI|nr:hypothetical protein BT67DRAFT_392206 [Trichocladium antarcticum]
MPSATPQPRLQKRASFRDRLKAWQKAPPSLDTATDQVAPRSVYQPKHAAADFSRLAVSPTSQTRARPRPMQTLAEDDGAAARGPHSSSQRRSPRADGPPTAKRHSGSGSGSGSNAGKRQSYALVDDPFAASQAAAHVPVNPWPVSWTPGVQCATQTKETSPPSPVPQPTTTQAPAAANHRPPPSDYELFLARAEAQDRARREQLLRSVSQRSAAARVKPDPHRQFAAATGRTSSEAGTSEHRRGGAAMAVSGEQTLARDHRAQRREREEERRRPSKGHARHASGSSGVVAGVRGGSGDDARGGGVRRRETSPPVLQAAQAHVWLPRRSEPGHQAVGDGVEGGGHRAHPPRTLRRQASLTQRFVEYIRPSKLGSRVETLVE